MLPKYAPGDHVMTFNWVSVNAGDVIAFADGGKFYIKRVKELKNGKIFVSGDNTVQSAKMGPVDVGMVVGKVILKY